MKVGIVGAGSFGSGLAVRLARGGASVLLGGRDYLSAAKIADSIREQWKVGHIAGGSMDDAAQSEVVVLALPGSAISEVAVALQRALAGKVVISPINDLSFAGNEAQPVNGESCAEVLQRVLPQSEVATAFNHLPARAAADLNVELDADVLICANSERAFHEAEDLVRLIDGLRPLRAGSLVQARAVESLAAILINVSRRVRVSESIRLVEQGAR